MTDDQHSFGDFINIDEIGAVAKSQVSNIAAASLAMGLMAWYSGDRQDQIMKKMAVMAAGQLAGSSLVDMLAKSGNIQDFDSPMAKAIEMGVAGGFYSVIALRGLRLPNFQNKQFQEAIVGSGAGIVLGPMIDAHMKDKKQKSD